MTPIRCARLAVILLLVLLASACHTLPTAGPSTHAIQNEGAVLVPFRLVDVNQDTITALSQHREQGLAAQFGAIGAPSLQNLLVGPGDGITVSLWETGANPLFSFASTPGSINGRGTTIPEQIVGSDGSITVPYAGRLIVAGRSTAQIQAMIEKALTGKTQTPQALVSVSHPVANAVMLFGDAVAGSRLPLSARGEHVLDALAIVGGARAPIYDTRVELIRGDAQASLPLSRLLQDPAENLPLLPGDQLVVTRHPQTFTAFGATGRNAQIEFEAPSVNLVEAVAKAGGLLDARADPQGVFLFRQEPAAVAAALPGAHADAAANSPTVPVVYRLDLTLAGGYFLGQNFELRDRDVLYVASAPANELQKFLVLLGLVSQPIINGAIIDQAAK